MFTFHKISERDYTGSYLFKVFHKKMFSNSEGGLWLCTFQQSEIQMYTGQTTVDLVCHKYKSQKKQIILLIS